METGLRNRHVQGNQEEIETKKTQWRRASLFHL
jgi:hypothetical protein